jgi:hypothetical protein
MVLLVLVWLVWFGGRCGCSFCCRCLWVERVKKEEVRGVCGQQETTHAQVAWVATANGKAEGDRTLLSLTQGFKRILIIIITVSDIYLLIYSRRRRCRCSPSLKLYPTQTPFSRWPFTWAAAKSTEGRQNVGYCRSLALSVTDPLISVCENF